MTDLENSYKVKDQEQRNALNAWAKAGYAGSIIAGTGFGKSRCGVLAAGVILRRDGGKGILIVPTRYLQDQFKEEFKKWGYEDVLDNLEIMCYQSACKLKDQHYTLVICDEVHLGLSPKYREFFTSNTFDKILCLTATLPEEDEYKKILVNLAPICYNISLDKCVDIGLIAPYQIYCVPIKLTAEEKAEYKKANNLFVQMKYKLGSYDAFSMAQGIIAGTIPGNKGHATQFFNAIRKRKTVVQHAVNKIDFARTISDEYIGKKILVFSGTNSFTDDVAENLKGLSYHSGKTTKQRAMILDQFKAGVNNILCSTKALNQGFNVPDSEIGIIAGLDSKALPMIQRVGRLLRLSPNKTGKIYILYVKDTQEEKWLNNALKGLNNITRDVDLTKHFKSNGKS